MKYFVAAAFVLCVGCDGTDVGNPVIDIEFDSYNLVNGTTTVESAWVVAGNLRLRRSDDCEGSTQQEIAGPFVIDLMSGEPPAPLSMLDVAELGYCRFEVQWQTLQDTPPAGAPDELLDASMVVTGTADGTPFSIQSRRTDELRLRAVDQAFTIDDATGSLFVAFDTAAWLSEVDFTTATMGAGGIVISDSENNTLLDAFNEHLESAVGLYDDDDHDGALDPDERDETDALAEGEEQ